MDIDFVREYLKKYRFLITRISRLKSMVKLCPEKKREYLSEAKRCAGERDEIEAVINSADGGLLSEILALKYMCGRTIDDISAEICYSRRQTERLHIKALCALLKNKKIASLQTGQKIL
ncbi:MAG: hypothetical protein IKZ47_02410 [Clostridia bacterium]|nr:hypothetical protein [Clostridia bacterium]